MVQMLTSEWAKVHEQMINKRWEKVQYTDKWTNANNAALHNFMHKSYMDASKISLNLLNIYE